MKGFHKFVDCGLTASVMLLAATIPFSIAASQLSLGLALLFWLLKLLTDYERDLLLTPISIPFLVWVTASIIAALFGDTPLESLLGIREEWLFFGFFVVWATVKSWRTWNLVLLSLTVAALLSATYSLWQHYTGLDLIHGCILMPMISGYRAQSSLSGFLTAGAVFSLIGFFLIAQYSFYRNWVRYPLILITSLSFVAALLTYSRSVIVALLLGCVVYMSCAFRHLRWQVAIIPALTIVITLLVVPDVLFRFIRENPKSVKKMDYRLEHNQRWEIWSVAWQMFVDHPITGVGQGNFKAHYNNYKVDRSRSSHGHAHNDILQIAATQGAVGVGAYIFFMVWIGWLLLGGLRRNNITINLLAAAGLASLAAYLALSLFENFFMDEETRLTFVFLLGMLFSGINRGIPIADNYHKAI